MKTNILSVLLLALLLPGACKEETPLPYDGKSGITFQPANIYNDTLRAYSPNYPDEESEINVTKEFFFQYDTAANTSRKLLLPLAVLGHTADFDRPFKIIVDPASTLDSSCYKFDLDTCYIPAKASQTYIPVQLFRPDVNDLEVKTLIFKLVPNEYFDYVGGDGQYFICTLSNKNYKPQYWDNYYIGVSYTSYFGLYSNNKFDFMHEVLYNYYGIDYTTWQTGYVFRQYATLEGIRSAYRSVEQLNNLQSLLHEE